MHHIHSVRRPVIGKLLVILTIAALSGCVGHATRTADQGDYVEIPNPAYTAPNAPPTIWVPRSYEQKGVSRGSEMIKRGFEAVKGDEAPAPPAETGIAASQAGVVGLGGTPAPILPQFGLVVAVDGQKVYFNLGRETGIKPGQVLKVYRGGTVIQGLGLAPGERVGIIEVVDFVGTRGGYGIIKQGGPVQANDLVGAEQ